MISGTSFEQGDIFLVSFPFTDMSGEKQRPVLIISKDNSQDDILVCGITSNVKDNDHSVLIDNQDLSYGFLPMESMVKVDKVFTLEKSIFKKKIARINDSTLN